MSKRQQSKYKICRRLGVNLWGRPKSPTNRRDYGPGQHGQRRRKPSDFGVQLSAKQRLRGYYGNITEKQFRRYYHIAGDRKGDTGENLIGLLERRLDAVVYRMKFVPTVFAARQFVNHGHILVNGRRVTIPSYSGEGRGPHHGAGALEAAAAGAGSDRFAGARRAGLSGGRSRPDGRPLHPCAEARRRALSSDRWSPISSSSTTRARARPSLTDARQAATAARRSCGALAEAPAAGRLP